MRDSIYGFAYRMTGETGVAEDITQEVFVFLVENPRKYDPERGSLFSFLCGVARNRVLNHLKKSGTRLESNFSEPGGLENRPKGGERSPLRLLLDKEIAAKVEDGIQNLSPFQREVLLLREMEELSYEEIAEITRTDVGVVKGRLYRARRALAEELAPYLKEECVYELH